MKLKSTVIPAEAGIQGFKARHSAALDTGCDTVPRQRGCGSRRKRPRHVALSRSRSGPSRTHRSGRRVGAGFRRYDVIESAVKVL